MYAERYGDVNGDGLLDAIVARCLGSAWPCDGPDAGYGEPEHRVRRAVHLNTGSGFEAAPSEPWTSALQALAFDAPTLRVKSYDTEGEWGAWTCHVERGSYRSGVFFNDRGETADDLDANYLSVEVDSDGLAIKEVAADTRWRLADLDGDGRVDLIASTRVGGVWQKGHRDCSILPEDVYHEAHERVVFRNTGAGWERAPSLETGIPAFSAMEISDFFAVGCDHKGWWGIPAEIGPNDDEVCRQMVDFPAQFVDLNGDGRLDLLASQPEDPRYNPSSGDEGRPPGGRAALADPGCDQYDFCENPMVTRAWLQEQDAAGDWAWVRAPAFDFVDPVDGDPLHTAHVEHWPFFDMEYLHDDGAATFMGWDDGVRLADLNGDGLSDLVWTDPIAAAGAAALHFNGPVEPVGVLLNTGSGWCSVGAPGSECAGAAALLPPVLLGGVAEQNPNPNYDLLWNTIWHYTLRDETGDGLPDLRRFGGGPTPTEPSDPYGLFRTWGSWPGSDGGSTPPPGSDPEFLPFSPGEGSSSWADRSGGPYRTVSDYARTRDLDGDGIEDQRAYDGSAFYFSIVAHPDLLRRATNGRGGEITFSYRAEAEQRDAALEALADAHAPDDAGQPRLGSRAVVASVTVDGPAQEPATTRYAYARGRWCPRFRSGLGFGLVRTTRPDGSFVDTHYYQSHGRAGRPARRTVWEAVPGEDPRALHHVEEAWELADPAGVAGAFAGDASGTIAGEPSRVGRLATRSGSREYGTAPGDESGALLTQSFAYDDDYGFNFVAAITTERPTGTLEERFAPRAFDAERWIAGRVASRSTRKAGRIEFGGSLLDYTREGRPKRERVLRARFDGGAMKLAWDYHRFSYDAFGNPVRYTDPKGRVTEFCYDTPSRPEWCPGAAGPATAGRLRARRDPGVGGATGPVTAFASDPVFGVSTETAPGYGDLPGSRVELDPFGRVARRWAIATDGAELLHSEVSYVDRAAPPFAKQVIYAAPGQAEADAAWSYRVDDGFGGVWKTIRDAGPPDERRHVAVARYRLPASRRVRTTLPVACADSASPPPEPDPPCEDVTGASESAAVSTTSDPLGRALEVATPRGVTRYRHFPSDEEVIRDPAFPAWERVDATLAEDANGHLVRRSFDGERLVAVEECAAGSSFAQATCARASGAPNRTLYGYHGNGRLEIVYDVFAVEAAAWSDPSHQLRYHFDGVGNPTRIEDPDAGVSVSDYDGAGNLVRTVNARGQQRSHVYDELDRPTRILTPPGEPDYALHYRPGEWLRSGETGPGYTVALGYDRLGRPTTEQRAFAGGSMQSVRERDLLGRLLSVRHVGLGNPIVYEYAGAFLTRVCKNECGEAGSLDLVADVAYDALGRRARVELAVGTRSYGYSGDGREDLRHLERDAFVGLRDATALSYGAHDALGNVGEWAVDSPHAEIAAQGSYAYDARNRLVAWQRTGVVSGSHGYAYDALGNLVLHEGVAQEFAGPRPHAVTARPGATYTHDASGNRTSIDRDGSAGDRTFAFDSANRLVCVGRAPGGDCDVLRVVYDAEGRRIREEAGGVTRRFLGDEQVRSERPEGIERRAEIFAFGERIAYQEKRPVAPGASVAPNHYRWVLTDRLGSSATEVDRDGAIVRQVRFRPFGGIDAVHEAAGATGGPRRYYAGHPLQEETGLVYMKARWLDPETGTFASVDPLVPHEDHPQSHNGYSYVGNNPTNLVDPDGRCWRLGTACGDLIRVPVVGYGPAGGGEASVEGGAPSARAGGDASSRSAGDGHVRMGDDRSAPASDGGRYSTWRPRKGADGITEWVLTLHYGNRGGGGTPEEAVAYWTSTSAVGVGGLAEIAGGFPATTRHARAMRSFAMKQLVPLQVVGNVKGAVQSARVGDTRGAAVFTADAFTTAFVARAVAIGQVTTPQGLAAGIVYWGIGGFDGIVRGYGVVGDWLIASGPNGPILP